ncbi:MAG: glycosyltransferase [Deltaproteobacteria bacterium]|nr:glycosyltransferase [Deltaproteobacteria bacterium]
MKGELSVSIVIPVFNEAENLTELIGRCLKACESMDNPCEIIMVDDGSTDSSEDKIVAAVRMNPGTLKGVFLNKNYGQHSAIMAGFEQAKGDVIVTLDADLQNPPEEIPNLVEQIKLGYDVVGSVRENRQDTLFRKISSFIINKTIQKVTGVMMNDYGCMLRAYKKHIIDAVLNCPERSTFIPVLANNFAKSTTEIIVKHEERHGGDSKYSLLKLISLQFDLLTCMTTFPLRLLSLIGGIISFFGVGFGIFLVAMRIVFGSVWAANGVFTLFAVLFILIGAQFIALGLLGEYLGRVYNDVRARPRYYIHHIIGKEEKQSTAKDTDPKIINKTGCGC